MNVNIPRLTDKDVEPLLRLVHAIEHTKNKTAKMAMTKLVVSYCQSLSVAGLHLHDQVWQEKHKPGEAVEVTSTSWFRR